MQTTLKNGFPSKDIAATTDWLTLLLYGHSAFQYLFAGCELGLFELLKNTRGVSRVDIQSSLRLEPHPARGLLMGLASLRLIEPNDGLYINGEAIERMLNSGDWDAFKETIRLQGKIAYIGQIDLVESLRTNTNVGLNRFAGNGRDLYHRLEESPGLQETFYSFMGTWSRMTIPKLLKAVDFSPYRNILDVGGGDATNAIGIAHELANVRISVMELPSNSDVPRANIRSARLEDRINVIERDMFAGALPSGYDCIMFIHQLVIWDESKNERLLKAAYEALPKGGCVVIFNSMAHDSEDGPTVAAMDSAYFLSIPVPGGLIYPWGDYNRWLLAAGFKQIQRIPCPGWAPHGAITAVKS
jgi:L-tyrosine C(3)-methyltransferase